MRVRHGRRWSRSRGLAWTGALGVAAAGLAMATTVAAPPAQAAPEACPSGTTTVTVPFGSAGLAWAPDTPTGGPPAVAAGIGGTGVDVSMSITDPAGINSDSDNALANLGESTVPSWQTRFPTQSDGVAGAGALTVGIVTPSSEPALAVDFEFSTSVLLPTVEVSAIDVTGYGFVPAAEPMHSYQDEVAFVTGAGAAPIAVELTRRQSGDRPEISGTTALGRYVVGADGQLPPGSLSGNVRAAVEFPATDALAPVTTFGIRYSNGPADAAAEASGGHTDPPGLDLGLGVSDSQVIGIEPLLVCVGQGSIGNRVWDDLDRDGVQDAGEPGLVGVDLQLTDEWGRPVAETTTVADGVYGFGDLLPQSWTVTIDPESLPEHYVPTYDLDGIGTVGSATTTVTAGQTRTDVDFGFHRAPVITWADPAPITFGTPLGPVQLNATADVPGSFSYHPPNGTVLPAGNDQLLTATFTPSIGAPFVVTRTIDVLPATPLLTVDVPGRPVATNPPLPTGWVRAWLRTPAGAGIAGETITFRLPADAGSLFVPPGTVLCTAVTNASGEARCRPSVFAWSAALGAGRVEAVFAGNANYGPVTSSTPPAPTPTPPRTR